MSPKPPDDGFDIDNFAYSEFASALEGEHPLSSQCLNRGYVDQVTPPLYK
jgi:hypothetical protein